MITAQEAKEITIKEGGLALLANINEEILQQAKNGRTFAIILEPVKLPKHVIEEIETNGYSISFKDENKGHYRIEWQIEEPTNYFGGLFKK